MGYGFTDPLRAARERDADNEGRGPAASLRSVTSVLFGLAGITLIAVLLAPDPDPSDHAALTICCAIALVMAVALRIWRRPPDAVLLAMIPAAIILTSALVATAKPIAATPFFYLWPIIVSAYFFRRREAALTIVFFAVAYGAALFFWVEPGIRMTLFLGLVVPLAVVGTLISAMKQRLEELVGELRLLATRDPLTQALNRRAFEDALRGEVARANRTGVVCSVALLDVDHFKEVNDVHGHAAGDRALTRLARVVEQTTRATDSFGRIGGEEFAVLLVDTEIGGAEAYAEQLRAAIADDPGDPVPMTVSVGVATVMPGHDSHDLLLQADRALYAAKRAGRNRVVRGDASLATSSA